MIFHADFLNGKWHRLKWTTAVGNTIYSHPEKKPFKDNVLCKHAIEKSVYIFFTRYCRGRLIEKQIDLSLEERQVQYVYGPIIGRQMQRRYLMIIRS